ncbi:MAG TPA: hypothetical protein VGD67_21070 [Pseudonocardiaceae bacterium]
MSRPLWNRAQDPGLLLRFVETGVVGTVLPGLPGQGGGGGPVDRTRAVFDAFALAGIGYSDEPIEGRDGWQRVRGPAEALRSAHGATCVDLAVAFSGACLDAGVHPLIVVLEPVGPGPAHALVVVWAAGAWTGLGGAAGYRDYAYDTATSWTGGLREEVSGWGAFVPVDVVTVTEPGASFEDAVRAGAHLLTSNRWRLDAVLDVGLRFDPQGVIPEHRLQLTGIHTHREEIAGLDGFRRNLLEGNLPFVPPTDPEDRTHPRRLLDELGADAGPPGVLLVGAAGVGKTRTCFEVAGQAIQAGWAVLHVVPGDLGVTSAVLHQAIVAERADRVLVVLDYLNEYRGLDLPTLRNSVLADARRRGIKVAFIASCRPGWHATTDAPLALLFDIVGLDPDAERTAAIRDQILRLVAPRATATIGLDRMREACGDRPVIAMLIASEAEYLCERDALQDALPGIRPADLLSWLTRRLKEDRLLTPRPRDLFADDEVEPSRKLQACVAMLLASPDVEGNLRAAGLEVSPAADGVLRRLRSMKWVVSTPDGLAPVHDLVTDQLVENVLLEPTGDAVRAEVVDRVLDACLTLGRTVGRFATNLSRVIRDLPPSKALPVRDRAGRWLAANTARAGERLAEDGDSGSYALGAILDNPAWSTVAYESWSLLLEPWLKRHSRSVFARHLLYKGLRTAPETAVDQLIAGSLTWLEQHDTAFEASFVLRPLLTHPHDDTTATTAVGHALTWLTHHHTTPEGSFVLSSLLDRPLDDTSAAAAVGHALSWLDLFGTTPDAEFTIGRLIRRQVDPEVRHQVVTAAFRWVETNGVGSDLVSKFISRLGELPVPIAARFVEWAAANPTHKDVPWRLTGMVRGVSRWPHLADRILTAVERVVAAAVAGRMECNQHGEIDHLVDKLCRAPLFRLGLAGARVDDIVRVWTATSSSLSSHCPPDTNYGSLTSRICSLCVIAGRTPPNPAALLDRMETWTLAWKCPEEDRAEALARIRLARAYPGVLGG